MPQAVGYLRTSPSSGSIPEQHKMLGQWYHKHLIPEFSWFGYARESGSDNHENILIRPRLQSVLDKDLDKGDMLLIGWFGVLCENLDDAIEGLPSILGRGIRVYVVFDCFEIQLEHLDLFRMLRREGYVDGSIKVPETLGFRICIRRSLSEIRFMQFCYCKHVMQGRTLDRTVKVASCDWPSHPRLGTPLTQRQIRTAIDCYHNVLVNLRLDRKVPAWVKEARAKGYFAETMEELAKSRTATLHGLA